MGKDKDGVVITTDVECEHKSEAGVVLRPEPDWAREGVQPKGSVGRKPPKNGRKVATRPEGGQ